MNFKQTSINHPEAAPLPASPVRWISTRAQLVVAACACAGTTVFVSAVDPNRHAVYPQCFLYNATGIYCAGCGATRALHALLHGRVLDALHDNALFIGALPLLLFVVGRYALQAWRDNAWPKPEIDDRGLLRRGAGLLGAMLAFMVVRNLPGWPFSLLRPLTS